MPALPGSRLAPCQNARPAPCSLLAQRCRTPLQHRPPPRAAPAHPPPLPASSLPPAAPLFPPPTSASPASGQHTAYCQLAPASGHHVCTSLGHGRRDRGQRCWHGVTPPPRPYPADAGRLGLARVPGWPEPAIALPGGTAAGFGQRRGSSSVQKWLLLCPGPAAWYWQTGAQLVRLCPRKPWDDLPNTEIQTRLLSLKLWYPMRLQCAFLTWDNLLSLVLIYKWLLSQLKKK